MSDFDPHSVAYGLHLEEFNDLPEKTRKQLVRLISRISEASFRRGFQHGCVQTKNGSVQIDPAILRFKRSLDVSPWAESASGGMSAIDRLQCEYGVLSQLGLAPL